MRSVLLQTQPRLRLSIPKRIFAAIFSLVLIFLIGSGVSVLSHRRSAQQLQLIHEGYLPLALTLARARSDQSAYASMLARLMSQPDSALTREWVERAVRVVLPSAIEAALRHLDKIQTMELSKEDKIVLAEIGALLLEVQERYGSSQELEGYLEALGRGSTEAQEALERLRRQDQLLHRDLRRAFEGVQQRLSAISREAGEAQRRAAWRTGLLASFGLLLGFMVMLWAERLLSPLPRLEARVLEVAQGDLSPRPLVVPQERSDEIGRLAYELEQMVGALRVRDAELRATTERLLRFERLATMGKMAAHITHEIRNPLNAMQLNAELLEEELLAQGNSMPAHILEMLRAIQREIARLSALTEQYLQLARLPAPRLEPEDVGKLVREVVSFVRKEMEEAGVAVVVEIEEGLPLVQVDAAQLKQALLNLLRNAREAMPEGGRIDIELKRGVGGIEIRVADRGPGIPEDARERLFDGFFSTKRGGTGLGLALTHQIVLSHQGQLRYEAREGGGTVFVITLPAPDKAPSPHPIVSSVEPLPAHGG
ncbi:MAG: ATP-binding protein [Sandaracinaceae bacterium]|nr:ATP-binding protein [Sandaracinaceae bacterium]